MKTIQETIESINRDPENMVIPFLVRDALNAASRWHGSQVRKYTGDPYILHPMEVAEILLTRDAMDPDFDLTPEMVAAAFLHDVVEDTAATIEDVREQFGPVVGELVWWLTDVSKPEDGNRKTRKALDRDHIAKASVEAKNIKLADLISNTRSIKELDPDFWYQTYKQEKIELLEVMQDADPVLLRVATEQINGD